MVMGGGTMRFRLTTMMPASADRALAVLGMLTSLAVLAPVPAIAQSLAIGMAAPVTSIDPHYRDLSPNATIGSNLFDALTSLDEATRLRPGLAESWRTLDDQTWEFKLRPGVTFQNGQELTGEDVAFTIARIPRVPNALFASYTSSIDKVTLDGPLTLRLHTKYVDPLLPLELAQVRIISHIAAATADTGDFNSGKAAIGTGPYRLVSYQPGNLVELERNESYWGKPPPWRRISYRTISNDAARSAALLSGDVQLIDAVPPTNLPLLEGNAQVTIAKVIGLRLIYIGFDHGRTGTTPFVFGPKGEILAQNPLRDHRVREALSLAINRDALVTRMMDNAAVPTGQFLPPGSFSYVPGLAPPPYDPQGAKKLLAEAGFPDGLRLSFHGPNDRYVNDGPVGQAIGQMWSRIGVQTSVEQLPWSVFFERCNNQEYSVYFGGWGTVTGEASNALRALLATYDASRGYGASNRGRYSNPALDELLVRSLQTQDDGAREKLLQQATTKVFDDVAIIPLYNQMNIWAMRKGLSYKARADELTLAVDVRPVE
jgi:peptide/nickel transport system substrate-binding protein